MKLIAVGTVAFDTIETPFDRRERVIGGAATYITLAASHFVSSSGLISVIGDDFPTEVLDAMKKRVIALENGRVSRIEEYGTYKGGSDA